MAMANEYERLPLSSDFDDYTFKDKLRARRRRCPPFLSLLLRRTPRIYKPLYLVLIFIAFLNWQLAFNASYAHPPLFRIPPTDTVFIAANIIDPDLISGAWGQSLTDLVALIGHDRVHVSIYGGPTSALRALDARLDCNTTLVSEDESPIDLDSIPRVALSTGETRIKRIAYLAEVRNRALEPLDELDRTFDKVLFLNDVHFSAADAARLLWGTNLNADGVAEYRAVCGMDFIKTWKYYDTFATRDLEGYSLGLPIFPWFASEGDATSRRDVLEGRDAVRVKSCWGGIVAIDARYLQRNLSSIDASPSSESPFATTSIPETSSDESRYDAYPRPGNSSESPFTHTPPPTPPIRFRSEPEPFWDSSECCLIHADLISAPSFADPSPENADAYGEGIFVNPHVRVAYDARTKRRLWVAQRFERLFTIPQAVVGRFAGLPRFNPRRAEGEGEVVKERMWVGVGGGSSGDGEGEGEGSANGNGSVNKTTGLGREWDLRGRYVDSERVAGRGGYCGKRSLLVLREGGVEGEINWEDLRGEVPPLE